jgi:hypothetical protein
LFIDDLRCIDIPWDSVMLFQEEEEEREIEFKVELGTIV